MTVPRHRIPKIKAACIVCLSKNVATILTRAQAAGYMRRHKCKDCGCAFYTLADYERKGYKAQAHMFKDRALTPWEQKQRLDWEAEAVTKEVTSDVLLATEFIETINEVFVKHQKGEALNEHEQFLFNTINQLEKSYDQQTNQR